MTHMNSRTPTETKFSKVRMNPVRIREESLNALTALAHGVGEASASSVAARILEAAAQVKPQNYHKALSMLVEVGSK